MPNPNQNNQFMMSILAQLSKLANDTRSNQYNNGASDDNIKLLLGKIIESLNKDFKSQKQTALEVLQNPKVNADKYLPMPISILQHFIPDNWAENARNQAYSSQVGKYLFNGTGDVIPQNMTVPQDKLNDVQNVIGAQNTADALRRLAWQQKQYIDYINSGGDAQQKANDAISGDANEKMNMLQYGAFEPNALGYFPQTGGFDINKMRAFADTLYNTAQRIR